MNDYASGIQHVGIPTKQFAKTKDFFSKLGFTPAYETIYEGANVSFMRLKNLTMEIYESDEVSGISGAIDHVAIDVNDIEKVYEEVCKLGLNTMGDEIHFLPYWENGVRFFTITGPNGEKIEFSQYC